MVTGELGGPARARRAYDTFFRSISAFCALLLLQACAAQTTALDSQNQAPDARQGRIYFIRHASVWSLLGGRI